MRRTKRTGRGAYEYESSRFSKGDDRRPADQRPTISDQHPADPITVATVTAVESDAIATVSSVDEFGDSAAK